MVENRTSIIKENRESFALRLTDKFHSEDIRNIMFSYDVSKTAHGHKGQKRDGGERFHEHPRAVALILLDECRITDAAIIKGALMHDVGEDTGFLGNAQCLTYPQLISEISYRVGLIAGEKAAEIVASVTKPTGTDMNSKTEEELIHIYHENLRNASSESLLVKMADRLHNLRTLSSCSAEKQLRKIKETKEFYLPLFEKVLLDYPKKGEYLLGQIKLEISKLST